MNAKILLVEDELALARLIRDNLIEEGFLVEHSPNGEAALKRFFDWEPDLVILDVMMPRKNGFKVAATIRNTDRKTPILFLTAKIKAADVVKGFQSGGNDYIRKPFAMAELLIRIQALLQQDRLVDRPEIKEETSFELGRFTFDSKRMRLIDKAGQLQKLTTRESDLLQLLCQNRNRLVTKSSILLKIWGDDSFFNSRSLDVFISRLRKYLKAEPSVNLVNLRGVGYKLVTD